MEANLLPFLQEQCQTGLISEDHVANILACIEAGAAFNEVLGDQFEAFLKFNKELESYTQTAHMQQDVLQNRLRKINDKLKSAKAELTQLEMTLELPRQELANWQKRASLFPDNPRILASFKSQQDQLAQPEFQFRQLSDHVAKLEADKARLYTVLEKSVDRI
jgi:chromosome segregation ATPase